MQDNENIKIDETTTETPANTESASKRGKPKDVKPLADADKKAPEVKAKPKKQAFIYLGPNIPGGILFNGGLFRCTPDEIVHLKETLAKLPEIKSLFIEVQKMPGFKKQILEQGTEAYRLYQVTEMKIREGVLKNVGV